MTRVLSAPARLAVIATLGEALGAWVKATWPMLLMLLLYLGLIIAIVAVLDIVSSVLFVVTGGTAGAGGLSPLHWIVLLLGILVFAATLLPFNVAGSAPSRTPSPLLKLQPTAPTRRRSLYPPPERPCRSEAKPRSRMACHQSLFSTYQRTVSSRPSGAGVRGVQPSSSRIFEASMA